LSGAGKTTIARELEDKLFSQGYQIAVLDGDNMRYGLCADLGFSREDRRENIRRVGEVARLFLETGTIAISAFISPYAADRDKIRASVPDGDYVEIYLECSIEECERRDPKGLYKKARAGIIRGFTGIDDPFEPPNKPELTINTEELTVEQSVNAILRYLRNEGYS
jgi:adenylylsulfate kinase